MYVRARACVYAAHRSVEVEGTGNWENATFCHLHTPKNQATAFIATRDGELTRSTRLINDAKYRQAGGAAGENGKSSRRPKIVIPPVPPSDLHALFTEAGLDEVTTTAETVRQYWMLKRRARHGVALLRRLQGNRSDQDTEETARRQEIRRRFYYIRQQLEKTRMITGQVVRRERLKLEIATVFQDHFWARVAPLKSVLGLTLESMAKKDTENVFGDAVSAEEYPNFYKIVKEPVDLGMMRRRVDAGGYWRLSDFVSDFHRLCANSMLFNAKGTWWNKYAWDFLHAGNAILEIAAETIAGFNLDPETQTLPGVASRETSTSGSAPPSPVKGASLCKDALATGGSVAAAGAQGQGERHPGAGLDIVFGIKLPSIEVLSHASEIAAAGGPKGWKAQQVAAAAWKAQRAASIAASSVQAEGPIGTAGKKSDSGEGEIVGDAVGSSDLTQISDAVAAGAAAAEEMEEELDVPDIVEGLSLLERVLLWDMVQARQHKMRGIRSARIRQLSESLWHVREGNISALSDTLKKRTGIACSQKPKKRKASEEENAPKSISVTKIGFDPGDLVWAKQRGWPWFPAQVVDPFITQEEAKMLKTEMPSRQIIEMGPEWAQGPKKATSGRRTNKDVKENLLYLVLFFDKKRSWGWIPEKHLSAMLLNSAAGRTTDLQMLKFSPKPAARKDIKEACVIFKPVRPPPHLLLCGCIVVKCICASAC